MIEHFIYVILSFIIIVLPIINFVLLSILLYECNLHNEKH